MICERRVRRYYTKLVFPIERFKSIWEIVYLQMLPDYIVKKEVSKEDRFARSAWICVMQKPTV